MTDRNKQDTANGEPASELDEAALDRATGGGKEATKHPAKVTVPDLKLGIGYSDHDAW